MFRNGLIFFCLLIVGCGPLTTEDLKSDGRNDGGNKPVPAVDKPSPKEMLTVLAAGIDGDKRLIFRMDQLAREVEILGSFGVLPDAVVRELEATFPDIMQSNRELTKEDAAKVRDMSKRF